MPNLYARATALPNVVGRVDYVSNDSRQEHLLAVYDGAQKLLDGHYWETLAQESQAAFDQFGQKTRTVTDRKTGEQKVQKLKCCQGRETVIQLSNSLLDKMKPEKVAKVIAWEYKKKLGLDVLVAVHYNAKENNLHAHVIFPERQLLQEPVIKVAERNLFFNAEGKRVYKKSEILDADKQLLPGCRIVKKGEIYEQRYFSSANPKFQSKRWLQHVKSNVILPLLNGKLRGDVEIKEYDRSTGELPYQHVGKNLLGARKEDAEKCNALVKQFNGMVRSGEIPLATALQIQEKYFKSENKTSTLQAEMDALQMARAEAQRQATGAQLIAALTGVQAEKKREADRLAQLRAKEEQQRQKQLQPVYELGELAGISRPEIDRMYELTAKATKADMQILWGKYKETKGQFWDEYNAQMADIRKEMDSLYRRRKMAKTMEWMASPYNNRKSLIGLIIVLIYVCVSKETVFGLDLEIAKLKSRQNNLREQAAAFKTATGDASETLRTFGRTVNEYTDSVVTMQRMADEIRGKHLPYLSPSPAPTRKPAQEKPKQPAQQPVQQPVQKRPDPFTPEWNKLMESRCADAAVAVVDFYRETYALHDRSRPVDPAVQNAPKDLQKALEALEAARQQEQAARLALSMANSMPFWKKKEKEAKREEAYAELRQATGKTEAAFEAVMSFDGISRWVDGSQLTGVNMTDEEMSVLADRVDYRVGELKRLADREAKNARDPNVPLGDPGRQRAAQERLEGILKEIPPLFHEQAWKSMNEALTSRKIYRYDMAGFDTNSALDTVRRRNIPDSYPKKKLNLDKDLQKQIKKNKGRDYGE